MPIQSSADLVELLRRHELLAPAQLKETAGVLAPRFAEPRGLAAELLRRGWATPYQINQLFNGKGDALVLGGYVLLERLGEGGMGQVFKARDRTSGRVVALKLVHGKRLESPNAERRFRREIRAASQIDHPNVVRAYDSDRVGDAYFFAMEYVEGIDLHKLVERDGPLPFAEACDYARQAALGLQHAHERGLVHRDVKPANLLLTRADGRPVVKLLDLGLARVDRPTGSEHSRTLTMEGSGLGTPDFMAPEQARNAHGVDIRADLYGLGCTLYFLIGGGVPFPEGNTTEKLINHTLHEPRPLEELRPGTPSAVCAVVRRLMAKRPEDRYQTPAEAAAVLGAVATADDWVIEPDAPAAAFADLGAARTPVPARPSASMNKIPRDRGRRLGRPGGRRGGGARLAVPLVTSRRQSPQWDLYRSRPGFPVSSVNTSRTCSKPDRSRKLESRP